MATRAHPLIAAMFGWLNGVYCNKCDADSKLTGWYTKRKIVLKFSYYRMMQHVFSLKHIRRCTQEEVLTIKKLQGKSSDVKAIATEFDGLMHLFELLATYPKYGYVFLNAVGIINWATESGGNIYTKKYHN